MAGQRRGERSLHRGRHRVGPTALALILLAACGGEPRDPGILDPGDGGTPGQSTPPSPVVGIWQADLLVQVSDDVQQWLTTWRFASDRTCHFERETFSTVEGIRRTVVRDCTYTLDQDSINVTYTDSELTDALPYEFRAFDADRLILEGVEYERIG